ECNGKLASALVGYGAPMKNNCGTGGINLYEETVIASHYFNLEIVETWQISAVFNALVLRQNEIAKKQLQGLSERSDTYMFTTDKKLLDEKSWYGDLAKYLLEASIAGLPLTGREARLIQEQYSKSVDDYLKWPYWNLWDPKFTDGQYEYVPESTTGFIASENIAWAIAHCFSPFRNPAGAKVVDCDIIRDPAKW
ncbi:MAG: hypothetical protein WC889_15270, partial [Myxococcota bacterium]